MTTTRLAISALVPLALALGGCLSDADTANNRSVMPLAGASSHGARDSSDGPRPLCESTSEGGEPKTVCY